MANLTGEVTVKVFAEASDELKAFIRAEVRKALTEILQEEAMQLPKPHNVPVEYATIDRNAKGIVSNRTQTLPEWARLG